VSRPGRVRGDERGVALVIVMLVLSLLLAIAGEFATAMRVEGKTALNFRGTVAAGYLAEAGYQRALVELGPEPIAHVLDQGVLVFRRARVELLKPPAREDIALGPGRFSYRITDEDSRLDLNLATPQQLQRLLEELGVERDARDVIVDSIQDWRDGNEEHRLNGAESDYYLALPVPYKAKNADLESVDELLQVRGVTPALFYGSADRPGLASYVTVAGVRQVNVNTASPVVLRAVLGYADAEVEQLVKGRPYLAPTDIPSNLRRGSPIVKSTAFRIEATGEVPGQGRRTLRVILRRQAGQNGVAQVQLKSWQWVHDEEARS